MDKIKILENAGSYAKKGRTDIVNSVHFVPKKSTILCALHARMILLCWDVLNIVKLTEDLMNAETFAIYHNICTILIAPSVLLIHITLFAQHALAILRIQTALNFVFSINRSLNVNVNLKLFMDKVSSHQ